MGRGANVKVRAGLVPLEAPGRIPSLLFSSF